MNNSVPRYESLAVRRLFLCLLLLFFTAPVFAQNQPLISGNYVSKSAGEVLKDISSRYNLKFAYDSFELEKWKGSWSFDEVTIDQFLDLLLLKSGYGYRMIDDVILIYYEADVKEELVPDSTLANETVKISGVVRDAFNSELLPFAVLTFKSGIQGATTDGDGRFFLEVPTNLDDTLVVFFVGYETMAFPFRVGEKDKKIVIKIEPQRNYLPDVMIEAEGVRSLESTGSAGIFVLNPASMTTSNGTGESDIMRAAQILPGIGATRESSNGLFIRGSNNDQILLSLDGFNIYHQDHFFGAFSAVNTNAVKAVSVHKGVTDARYGGRIGGFVEVIGREGSLNNRNVQIDLSPLSAGIVFESPMDTAGKSSFFITARRAYTGLLYTPTYKSLFNTAYQAAIINSDSEKTQAFGNQNPEFYFQDLNAKFSFRTNAKNTFNLSAFLSRDELFVQYADTTDLELVDPRDVNYEDESTKKNSGVSARWLHEFNDVWESNVRIGVSSFNGAYFSSDSIRNLLFDLDSVRFSSEQTLLKDFDARAECTGKMKSGSLTFGLQLNQLSSYLKQNEQGNILADSSVTGQVLSGYFSFTSFKYGKLHLNPGLRTSYFSRNQKIYAEPRLIIDYEVIPDVWKIKSSAGRTNQFIQRTRDQSLYQNTPDFWQLAESGEVPVLSSNQISIGTVYHHTGFTLDVEAYAKQNSGVVTSQWFYSGHELYVGDAKIFGVDLLCMKDYRRHHFTAGYSWMDAKADYPDANLTNIPMNYWINHEVKLNYELKLNVWSFSAFWVYGSGAPYTPLLGTWMMDLPDGNTKEIPVYGKFNSGRLPDYHRLDIAATWKKNFRKWRLEIAASVFNTYNRNNIRNVQYVVLSNYNDEGRLKIGKRTIGMLNVLPTVMIRLKF